VLPVELTAPAARPRLVTVTLALGHHLDAPLIKIPSESDSTVSRSEKQP
jgi:hypothetical protein